MDFRQTVQPNTRTSAANTQSSAPAHEQDGKFNKSYQEEPSPVGRWIRVFTLLMLAGIVVLLAAIAFGFGRGGHDNESQFINKDKYQAVFLNTGQVYFGNITKLNDKYIHMTNIYYLTQASSSDSSSSSNNNNYSLVKLGCQQIHDPYDAMVINRDQISFWENIQDDGKVVTSIKQFKQQNPNGPDCSQVSNQTQATQTQTQGDSTGTGSTTGTTDDSSKSTK